MGTSSAKRAEEERADKKKKKKEKRGKDTLTTESKVGLKMEGPSKESAKKTTHGEVLPAKSKREHASEVVQAGADSLPTSRKKKRKTAIEEGPERQKKDGKEETRLSNGTLKSEDQDTAEPTERVKERKRKAASADASSGMDSSFEKKKRQKGSKEGAEGKLHSRKKSKKVKDTLKLEADDPVTQDVDQERQPSNEGEHRSSSATEAPSLSKKKKGKKSEGTERQKKDQKEAKLLSKGRSEDKDQDTAESTRRVKERKRRAALANAVDGIDPAPEISMRKKGSKEEVEEQLPSQKKSKKVKSTLISEAADPFPNRKRQAADESEHKGPSADTEAPSLSKKKKRKKTGNAAQDESPPETAGPSNLIKEPEREVSLLVKERADTWKTDERRSGLKYGKFTKEEDEIVKAAVAEYIEGRNLGSEAVQKLLSTRKHTEVLGAWLEIGRCLPYRSIKRVHARALRLLHEGNYKGKWSAEEEELLRLLYAQWGPKWAKIGGLTGRLPDACKDKWRLLKVTNKQKGAWSQREKDTLCRLVRENLSQKEDENIVDGRIVKDNINWMAISEKMGGRDYNQCLLQWYKVIAPDRVWTRMESSDWSHDDDQLMLQRIMESGAASEPDVEWNDLLPGKDGSLCRKRWRMMVKHLAPLQDFEGKLRQLCERYAPSLLNDALSSGRR